MGNNRLPKLQLKRFITINVAHHQNEYLKKESKMETIGLPNATSQVLNWLLKLDIDL